MSFKIIALKVLDSCESKHYKNLMVDIPYVFYKNYKISNSDCEVVELITDDFDLYSKDTTPNINVSAIVGKNGSGKSTIIELLIKGINNFYYIYKEQNPTRDYHINTPVSGVAISLIYKIQNEVFKLKIFQNNFCKIDYEIYKGISNEDNRQWEFTSSKERISKNMDSFFYTEIMNYSLYAFNSRIEGAWISQIFHKNDGYQTPIVLNPWRDQGNIDINKENTLVYQRLLANLLRFDQFKTLNLELGDSLKANSLVLDLQDIKHYEDKANSDFEINLSKFNSNYRTEILNIVLQEFFGKNSSVRLKDELLELLELYIIYKLISICHRYNEYQNNYFDFIKADFSNLKGLASKLKADDSHITFKLRQSLNYLVYNHIPFEKKNNSFRVEIKDLAEIIEKISKGKRIIDYLPPPIFRVDIELSSIKSNQKEIRFNTLSSGEKQQIYVTNSIYYHLINLDSVSKVVDTSKNSYNYVNLVLEEIELYFHPEYQRVFLSKLINGIQKLNLKKIQGINLILVTHSPFILSDIPSTNIIYLTTDEQGKSIDLEDNKNSFASNIHHLLANNFFFDKKVYIGEVAKTKINEAIVFINQKENQKKNEEEIEYYYQLINLIGEPILKNKLSEMLFDKFPTLEEQKNLDKKEMMVQAYAEQMGIKINIKK